ncbi:MAG: hypothetical protein ACAI44_23695, partial [Candidatus Sericytochromatia bacterium]
MPDISSYPRIARFVNGDSNKELFIRSEHGVFASHEEAEKAARKVADAANLDAVIIQDEQGFHVYGIDELHSLLPGGSLSGEVIREAPIVAFVATDPLSGVENVIGHQSAAATGEAVELPPTALDRYAKKYSKQLNKVLGSSKDATIQDLNQRIRALEATGLKITIEMDDDVFEYKDKLEGFKYMLDYALQNSEALKERSIREIAIMDEWDNAFGTKVDLEYDKKEGVRRLEIGDDFLDDWGESLNGRDKGSVKKIEKELGGKLKENEIVKRSEIFQDIRSSLGKSFDRVNALQQASLQHSKPPKAPTAAPPAQTAPTAAAQPPAPTAASQGPTAPADPAPQAEAAPDAAAPADNAAAPATPDSAPAPKPADPPKVPTRAEVIRELDQTIERLEKEVIPKADKTFDEFSIKQERQLSEKYLDTFKKTLEALRGQVSYLKSHQNLEELEYNARLEKIKLILVKGVKEIPDDKRNYFGTYVGGLGSNAKPSAGLEFAHAFGEDRETVASIRAGTTAPLKSAGLNNTDIMLGLGLTHTFHSRNKLLDGASVGVGVGFSRETPFFIGVSASQSWYLNDFHALEREGSAVGGLHATLGTYNNIGATLNLHKQINDHVEFEGYGEVSLLNQGAEIEGEFAFSKNKDVYLTAGVGTNKLAYVGVGFADKYELEVGVGGASFGKDSNNLPGESGWEVGVRFWPLPLPYFRHQRVPGYQFTYNDKSTEYITPNGTFMTIKEDDKGDKYRQAYIPDPKGGSEANQLVYRRARAKEDLEHLDKAPKREITIGPLGYLTVVENGETIVED